MALFRVVWTEEFEADSALEAAFMAYKFQRQELLDTVRFDVSSDSETVEDVTLAKFSQADLLTERERTVADLVRRGASNGDIADTLDITERTVKAHIASLFKKFHVTNRVALATRLIRLQRSGHGRAA